MIANACAIMEQVDKIKAALVAIQKEDILNDAEQEVVVAALVCLEMVYNILDDHRPGEGEGDA